MTFEALDVYCHDNNLPHQRDAMTTIVSVSQIGCVDVGHIQCSQKPASSDDHPSASYVAAHSGGLKLECFDHERQRTGSR